jgi:ribonuclease HII
MPHLEVLPTPLEMPGRMGLAGVDEVGRGPLAGPVVAAAVILPIDFDPTGLNDSKQLSSELRREQAKRIKDFAVWSVAFVCQRTIDEINILQATYLAMRQALMQLATAPEHALIDGDKIPPGLCCSADCLIKGDARHASIAAASILAKVARDDFMIEQAARYPEYGFERHVGYATPEHLAALEKHGPCDLHRFSFSPIRKDEEQLCLTLDL